MHNAALAHIGLSDWRYEALPVAPENLAEAVAALRGAAYAGANVTVPHKEAVIPFLHGLTPVAQAIGAVNTIVKLVGADGRPPLHAVMERGAGGEVLIGHNTDAAGLLADLHANGVSISNAPILILGAGGSARAAVAACMGVGAHIRMVARRREQAAALLRQFSETAQAFDWSPSGFRAAVEDCVLIINCTPIGMTPNVHASPWPAEVPFPTGAFVYDLIYNPAETELTRTAKAAGLRAATGLGMLIEQGALAFELWTEKTAPRQIMRHAAEEKLRQT
jgi:shikimate dehydrogenase